MSTSSLAPVATRSAASVGIAFAQTRTASVPRAERCGNDEKYMITVKRNHSSKPRMSVKTVIRMQIVGGDSLGLSCQFRATVLHYEHYETRKKTQKIITYKCACFALCSRTQRIPRCTNLCHRKTFKG